MQQNKPKRLVQIALSRLPIFVWLIAIISLISILEIVLRTFMPQSIDLIALQPAAILSGQKLWTLVTHIFFHANLPHLLINMFSLLFIGGLVETIIGKKRFIIFFIITGVIAGIFSVLCAYLGSITNLTNMLGDPAIPGVGASGALFGLLGILAVLLPRKKVYLILGPIFLIILMILIPQIIEQEEIIKLLDMILNILLLLMIVSLFIPINFLRKISLPLQMPMWVAPIVAIIPLTLISYFISLPIGNMAHLGGLLVGLIYGISLRLRYPRKVSLLERMIR